MMRALSEAEVTEIAGGVTAGPNGETCTEPRKTETDTQNPLSSLIQTIWEL